jgi:F-type H+-transporting ATPase subunit epsilon
MMQLDILTPGKKVFSGEVVSSTFPGVDGQFQILNSHAPIISILAAGSLKYQTTEGVQVINVTGGLVEVNDNKIIVLADGITE